jgi:hypothetical protein
MGSLVSTVCCSGTGWRDTTAGEARQDTYYIVILLVAHTLSLIIMLLLCTQVLQTCDGPALVHLNSMLSWF